MDAELWAARLAAAKRQHSLHHSQPQFDRLSIDDFEVDEDVRPDFSCPYCFDDYDIASLCSHLEDEHPFESKAAVCPVCTLKVGRDMLNHITTQHGHLFKIQRRRRLRRVAVPHSSTLSLLSRELREAHLQVLLGGGALRSGINSSSTIADSLLSSLVLNFPGTEAEEISKSAASIIDAKSAKSTSISQQWKAWPCSHYGNIVHCLSLIINELACMLWRKEIMVEIGISCLNYQLAEFHGIVKICDESSPGPRVHSREATKT